LNASPFIRLATLAACFALAAPSVLAASSASSATSMASDSIGSVSDSISASSKSSTGDKKVSQGEYKVREVALETHPSRGEVARLSLEGEAGRFELLLPRATQARHEVQVGQTVAVSEADWGYRFSLKGQSEPFFLALNAAWQGSMHSKPLAL
jgi:hypothetical protein